MKKISLFGSQRRSNQPKYIAFQGNENESGEPVSIISNLLHLPNMFDSLICYFGHQYLSIWNGAPCVHMLCLCIILIT